MENKKIINSEEIKHYIQQEKIQYIKVGITDVDGVLRGKYMHSEKFMKALEEGFGFCDVIFGWDLHDELYIFRESKDYDFFLGVVFLKGDKLILLCLYFKKACLDDYFSIC